MNDQTPLNPGALGRVFATAMMEVLDAEKLMPGKRLVHVNDMQEVLNRLEKNILAVAQPVVNSVEELDALPLGSLVRAGVREFYKTSCIANPWVLSYGVDRFGSDYLAKYPTEVIHRPEVGA
ncbi:MAG: hypothetical protein ACTIAQ_04280 [Glutamicibacter arilaitensis]